MVSSGENIAIGEFAWSDAGIATCEMSYNSAHQVCPARNED
jgi:hypothetical protein